MAPNMEPLRAAIAADLEAIRSRSPVCLNLTNYVSMDLTANALLAIGASPVMAHAKEEMEEMVGISQCVALNLGTLDTNWLRSMGLAVEIAHQLGKPIVLDPVGAGCSRFRTQSARALLARGRVTVIRSNASEVLGLFADMRSTRGVDSAVLVEEALETGRRESQGGTVIVVSGATDYVFEANRCARLEGGHPLMARVTAMGCTATSLVGAFLAVNPSPFHAAVHAMAVMGVCGELAAEKASGPGSYRTAFIDALSSVDFSRLAALRVFVS